MTAVRPRSAPLHAATPPRAEPESDLELRHVVATHGRTDDDRRSFAAAVRSLRTGGASIAFGERTLMVIGGVIAPLGLLFVLLGWIGASHTPNLFEQIPYLISGGLFGLGLVFLGAFLYFAHWITELVKEQRAQSAALLDAIERLRSEVGRTTVTASTPAAPEVAHRAAGALVATPRGSMVHRPDCVVVAGKANVQVIDEAGDLTPCKLCDPLAED